SGNSNFAGSTGALNPFVVSPANSSTVVTAAPIATVFGQSVTFTATISAVSPGAGIASGGTRQFFDGGTSGTPLGSSSVITSGSATLTTNVLPANPRHTITAVFGGNTSFTSSTGTLTGFVVNPANTTTVVTASPSSSVSGQAVTFTATVTAVAPGSGIV